MADGLLNKASIILTPTGYKAGTLYNVAPVVEPYEDFDFARASVASRVNSSGLVEMVGRTLGSELVQNGDFSELGSELVTNGDFATDSDWSFIGTTEISGGIASFPNSTNSFLIQSNVADLSVKNYKLTYEVVSTNGNNFRLAGGSSAFGLITLDSATIGTKTAYLTSNGTQGALQFNNHNFVGSIDNVSVKQVDPNDYWTKGTGWSIGDGKATSDGSQTANSLLYQSGILSIGTTFKAQLTLSNYQSGTLRFVLGGGGSEISCSSNGTFTFYGNKGADNNLYLSANSTFEGSVDNVSVKEIIDTNNIPRISYDSNGDNGHILLEPTSTNLVPYSEDFSQGAWSKTRCTILANQAISPDGTLSADLMTATDNDARLQDNVGGANVIVTQSIYVKSATGGNVSGQIDFSGTNIVTFTANNEWQRVETTLSDTGISPRIRIRITNDGDALYIWGGQVEALSYATSYIPTNGLTVTRDAETCTNAGNSTLINSTEGVLYAEIAGLVDADASDRVISLSDNSITNRVEMKLSSSGSIKGRFDSASSDITLTETGLTASNFNKIALVWSSGKCALFINGVKEQEDLTFNTFASDVLFDLSFDSAYLGGSSNFYGKCKALAVFNEALSDDELNNLTG